MAPVDVYEVLGGRKALGVPPPELSELRLLLQEGLPFPALESVRDALGLSRTEVLSSLGITARTLARRKRDRRLDPAESDRLFRLARLTALALEVLEDPDVVRRWLHKPNRALGGEVPVAKLASAPSASSSHSTVGPKVGGMWTTVSPDTPAVSVIFWNGTPFSCDGVKVPRNCT